MALTRCNRRSNRQKEQLRFEGANLREALVPGQLLFKLLRPRKPKFRSAKDYQEEAFSRSGHSPNQDVFGSSTKTL
jgi:hypothetical protein